MSKTRKMQREKAAQEGVGARNRKMEGTEEEGRQGSEVLGRQTECGGRTERQNANVLGN